MIRYKLMNQLNQDNFQLVNRISEVYPDTAMLKDVLKAVGIDETNWSRQNIYLPVRYFLFCAGAFVPNKYAHEGMTFGQLLKVSQNWDEDKLLLFFTEMLNTALEKKMKNLS